MTDPRPPFVINKETLRKSNGVSLEVLAMRRIFDWMEMDRNLHPSDEWARWKPKGTGTEVHYTMPQRTPSARGDFKTIQPNVLFRNTSGHEIIMLNKADNNPQLEYRAGLPVRVPYALPVDIERWSLPLYVASKVFKGHNKDFVLSTSSKIGNFGRFHYMRGILKRLGVVMGESGVISSDTSDDAYVSKLAEVVSKLHTVYFKKCFAFCDHMNTGAEWAFWPLTDQTALESQSAFDTKTENILDDIRDMATWAYDLHMELQSFEDSGTYVVEELFQSSGYEIDRQKNGDLRVTVKSPKDIIQQYFTFLHEGKMKVDDRDWSEYWENYFLKMAPPKYKYLWKKVEETKSVPMTLERVLGLTIDRQIKFFTDNFDITERQVYLLAHYVKKCHNASFTPTPGIETYDKDLDKLRVTSLNREEKFIIGSTGEWSTVTSHDLDAVYRVVSKMTNNQPGLHVTGDPKNMGGWLLGFDKFKKTYDAYTLRAISGPNVRSDSRLPREIYQNLRPTASWDSGATIPGMVEFTSSAGEIYVSYNFGKGKDHWFRPKDLPCGDLGWIWKDRNLGAYVFCWKYRTITGELDRSAMAPYLVKTHEGTKVMPMGLLEELWKYPPKDKMEKIGGKWYYLQRGQRLLTLNDQRQSAHDNTIDWSYRTED